MESDSEAVTHPLSPQAELTINNDVELFLRALFQLSVDRDVEGLKNLYDVDYNHITEQHFANSRWPSPAAVNDFFGQNPEFGLVTSLYGELYYRHLFSRCYDTIELSERTKAGYNYSGLVGYFIENECMLEEEMKSESSHFPFQWVWDILDEYVYQYQDAQMLLASVTSTAPTEDSYLKSLRNVWAPTDMFANLHTMIAESGINDHLRRHPDLDIRLGDDYFMKHQLGYFSMVALLRLCVLHGEHQAGLDAVANLRVCNGAFFWKVPACAVSLFYYNAVANIMLRRYEEAVKMLSQFLLFINKSRSYLSSQSQQQRKSLMKMTNRMSMLLLLCTTVISGDSIDDLVSQQLRDLCSERCIKISLDDEETIKEVFLSAMPKFISLPNAQLAVMSNAELADEARIRQLNVFLREVRYQRGTAAVRSFAKLYNNISLQKLAELMEVPSDESREVIRARVLCVGASKLKSRADQQNVTSLLSDEADVMQGSEGVNFLVDQDMLYVENQSLERNYIDYFISEIKRTKNMNNMMSNMRKAMAKSVQYVGCMR